MPAEYLREVDSPHQVSAKIWAPMAPGRRSSQLPIASNRSVVSSVRQRGRLGMIEPKLSTDQHPVISSDGVCTCSALLFAYVAGTTAAAAPPGNPEPDAAVQPAAVLLDCTLLTSVLNETRFAPAFVLDRSDRALSTSRCSLPNTIRAGHRNLDDIAAMYLEILVHG